MTVYRSEVGDDPYARIQNRVLRDPNVTDALGLLCYLLSMPRDWDCRTSELMRRFDCGQDKLQRWTRQLRDAGYLRLKAQRNPETGGWTGKGWSVFDTPQPPETQAETDNIPADDEDDGLPASVEAGADAPSASHAENAGHGDFRHGEPENPGVRGQAGFPPPGKPGSERQTKDSNKTPYSPPLAANALPHPQPLPDRRGGELSGFSDRRASRDELPAEIERQWRVFEAAWPWQQDENRVRPRRKFARMSDADRRMLVEVAPKAVRWHATEKKTLPKADTFIGQERWKSDFSVPAVPVFVIEGTDAFRKWIEHDRRNLTNGAKRVSDGRGGCRVIDPYLSRGLHKGVMRQGLWRPELYPPPDKAGEAQAEKPGDEAA